VLAKVPTEQATAEADPTDDTYPTAQATHNWSNVDLLVPIGQSRQAVEPEPLNSPCGQRKQEALPAEGEYAEAAQEDIEVGPSAPIKDGAFTMTEYAPAGAGEQEERPSASANVPTKQGWQV